MKTTIIIFVAGVVALVWYVPTNDLLKIALAAYLVKTAILEVLGAVQAWATRND